MVYDPTKTPEEVTRVWEKFINKCAENKVLNPDNPKKESDLNELMCFRSLADQYGTKKYIPSNGVTLLMRFANLGQDKIVNSLIHEYYADVHAVDDFGMNALHHAAISGNANMCSDLIQEGADPTAVNKNGSRPGDMAASNGFKDLGAALNRSATAKRLGGVYFDDFFSRKNNARNGGR